MDLNPMASSDNNDVTFLQWALPELGYRWNGFKKPRGQVLKRIRSRMQELELEGGFPQYREFLKENPEEWEVLDRLCDVTISKFFRDRKLWDYLRDHVMRDFLKRKQTGPVNIWSAGCCNGEETYSAAVVGHQLLGTFPVRREISILATDRNRKVLQRAREGRYPSGALKELSDKEVRRFFHPINHSEDDFRIDERLSQCIAFEQRDIRRSLPDRVFDIVFCRNLAFTYFSLDEQRRFLECLKPHITKGGFLIIGSNEALPKHTDWLQLESETHPIYKKSRRCDPTTGVPGFVPVVSSGR